jgi:TRAP-type C4-dicarboxylate transport system substrate-binding protein
MPVLFVALMASLSYGAQQEVKTLKWSSEGPPVGPEAQSQKWMADEITKRTGGQLKFRFFWSQTLLKRADSVAGVSKGVADFAHTSGIHTVNQNPFRCTMLLPGSGTNLWSLEMANYEVLHTNPDIQAEFDRWNVVPTYGKVAGTIVLPFKKQTDGLEAKKGKRIRAFGGSLSRLLDKFGMVPVQMPNSSVYESVERGVLDAAFSTWYLQDTYKFYEVCKHYYLPELGAGGHDSTTLINKDVWNGFTQEQRDIITEVSKEYNNYYVKLIIENEEKWRRVAEKNGVTVHPFTPEENAAFEKASEAVREEWINRFKEKDKNVSTVWEQLQQLNAKYDKELAEKGYPWER